MVAHDPDLAEENGEIFWFTLIKQAGKKTLKINFLKSGKDQENADADPDSDRSHSEPDDEDE